MSNWKRTAIKEGYMRIIALAITAVLAVCVADSALAAKKKHAVPNSSESLRPDFDKCEAQSIQLGVAAGQTGHREWMMQCLHGIITGRPGIG
jgi:hypothetical protein